MQFSAIVNRFNSAFTNDLKRKYFFFLKMFIVADLVSLTDRSKAVPLLWNFYVFFCLVLAMHLYASVYMCLVVNCWERADLLALVCGV